MIDRDRIAKTRADILGVHRRIKDLLAAGKPARIHEGEPGRAAPAYAPEGDLAAGQTVQEGHRAEAPGRVEGEDEGGGAKLEARPLAQHGAGLGGRGLRG